MEKKCIYYQKTKKYLREKYIIASEKYKNLLMDKDFLVICEDNSEDTVTFFAKDFKHLTEIKSDLIDGRFF